MPTSGKASRAAYQGLGRSADLNVLPRHIVEDLAIHLGGNIWDKEAVQMIRTAERVIF